MKTYKSTQNGFDIVAKFTEVKGDEKMVNVKVYIKISGTDHKKSYLPANLFDEKYGLSTDEERKEFVSENRLRINWFLEGLNDDKFDKTGSRLITPHQRGQINFPFYWGAWYSDHRYEISGIDTSRDYYTFIISKENLMKYPIVLKIVKRGEHWWELDDDFEPWILISIDASNCLVSGQRRANKAGFNGAVERYLNTFGGLGNIPKFESLQEYQEWYFSLNQHQADSIRKAAKNYDEYSFGKESTPRQRKFIQENGPEYMQRYGSWQEGSWYCSMQLASAIIDTISKKIPATDAQKKYILSMDPTYNVETLSKSEASSVIEHLINR